MSPSWWDTIGAIERYEAACADRRVLREAIERAIDISYLDAPFAERIESMRTTLRAALAQAKAQP
jgi:hypothetical protein